MRENRTPTATLRDRGSECQVYVDGSWMHTAASEADALVWCRRHGYTVEGIRRE